MKKHMYHCWMTISGSITEYIITECGRDSKQNPNMITVKKPLSVTCLHCLRQMRKEKK